MKCFSQLLPGGTFFTRLQQNMTAGGLNNPEFHLHELFIELSFSNNGVQHTVRRRLTFSPFDGIWAARLLQVANDPARLDTVVQQYVQERLALAGSDDDVWIVNDSDSDDEDTQFWRRVRLNQASLKTEMQLKYPDCAFTKIKQVLITAIELGLQNKELYPCCYELLRQFANRRVEEARQQETPVARVTYELRQMVRQLERRHRAAVDNSVIRSIKVDMPVIFKRADLVISGPDRYSIQGLITHHRLLAELENQSRS